MLIHAIFDNKEVVKDGLNCDIYDGFFDGVENWFASAVAVNSNLITSNLTNLNTITNNFFNSQTPQSVRVSGAFRAKKTGTYRFFTYSTDKNILEIDGDDIIVNNNVNQISFANKSLIAGRYYSFFLYYGIRGVKYPPIALTAATTNVSGQSYGNGDYTATSSSNNSGNGPFRAFDFNYSSSIWQSLSSRYNNQGNYSGTASTTTTEGPLLGEWLQIQLPNAIVLDKFQLTSGGAARPRAFTVFGSNTGIDDWNAIFKTDNIDNIVGNWAFNQTITLSSYATQAYSYYRMVVISLKPNSGSIYSSFVTLAEWTLYDKPDLQCGYLEPNQDGTSGGSTNPNDFISNATGLSTYYLNTLSDGGGSLVSSLIYTNPSLYGRFKIDLLGLYVDRSNFTTTKDDLLYISSPQLYIPGSGSRLLVLHEEPVSGDSTAKDYHLFSDDFELVCDLKGYIELIFQRQNIDVSFQRALLVMQAEPT